MTNKKQMDAYRLAQVANGTKEIKGPEDNPKIVAWFRDVKHGYIADDETAWCAAFLGAMLERAGLQSTRMLNARSYLDWGEAVPTKEAQPGDIVVFWRGSPSGWQGHVGFFVGWRENGINVLGGNQADAVRYSIYPSNRLLGIRRFKYDPQSKPSTGGFWAAIVNFFRALFGGGSSGGSYGGNRNER